MGIPDASLLNILEKVRSWISWRASDRSASYLSSRFEMPNNRAKMCCDCDKSSTEFFHGYNCQCCGRWLCLNCIRGYESAAVTESNYENRNVDPRQSIKSCKFCNGFSVKHEGGRKNGEKVHPSESSRESPEPPSPCFSGESIQRDRLAHDLEFRDCEYSSQAGTNKIMTSFGAHTSPVSVRHSSSRSDEEEAEDSGKHFYSPQSECCHDILDMDSSSVSARYEFYNFKSVGSSPLDSPSWIDFTSSRVGHPVQQGQEDSRLSQTNGLFDQENRAVLRGPDKGTENPENTDDYSDHVSILQNQHEKSQKPLDFERNGLVWFPPPPEDENDEVESAFFTYDDDDDDIGDSAAMFSSSSSLSSIFPSKEKQNEGNKEPLRAVIEGHFRALVSQLLQGEGFTVSKEDNGEDWLDIVTTVAWQAANFVKPDTSRGGSMDPCDYIKVKCIASGRPSDSTFVKGVVCTKNIKHKRMTTQYKNPRILLLGGAFEYRNVMNQLASFNTLVQQENDHLKMIISKIETLRPNVLLVEKSVSPLALEYLLAKEISLVLNVKKPLLERISRCTGARISSSIDNISTARLGHCELFRIEKVSEEHGAVNLFNKKPSKTLMFFEGCPRRLGCTVLLRGTCCEELKKIKHVIYYAVFAAYHLSLETSFLADEGASLPKMQLKHSIAAPERIRADNAISVIPSTNCHTIADTSARADQSMDLKSELGGSESMSGHLNTSDVNAHSNAYHDGLASHVGLDSFALSKDLKNSSMPPSTIKNFSQLAVQDGMAQEDRQLGETCGSPKSKRIGGDEVSSEYFSGTDTHQSILVSFSSHCVVKGMVCERSRLIRIKFYGSFDKPLGRYLRDDLFDQASYCRACKEPAEAHVLCYTHQQGNLTINVRSLSSVKLHGEANGKIWMWHRCLRCAYIDGVPPATRRVLMSDAAWGLSFGKFLELSFSNHATANRVAPCGHSLQRDCLRFYGFGSMVAFFHYSPINIFDVHLAPSVLEFNGRVQKEWLRKEAAEILGKMENLYEEIYAAIDSIEQKNKSFGCELSDTNEIQNLIVEMREQHRKERNDYNGMLQLAIMETSQLAETAVDVLELNRIKHALLIVSHVWDHRLYSLNSLVKKNSVVKTTQEDTSYPRLKQLRNNISCSSGMFNCGQDENDSDHSKPQESVGNDLTSANNETTPSVEHVPEDLILPSSQNNYREDELHSDGEVTVNETFLHEIPSHDPNLSDRIDSAWTGTDQLSMKVQSLHASQPAGIQAGAVRQISLCDNPPLKRIITPARVHSFDSVMRVQERIQKGLPPSSLHLLTHRSFHATGDYRSMVRDPVSNAMRTSPQTLPLEAQKLNFVIGYTPSFISTAPSIAGGARLLLPQKGYNDLVIGVYDDDPASIVSYALSSKEYEHWIANKSNENEGSWSELCKEDFAASTFSAWQSFASVDLDSLRYTNYGSEDPSVSISTSFTDSKRSPHLTISYGDDSSITGGEVKFSVTCYFAKQFDSLRRKCCPSKVDFIRSLSRCQRWSAQGGKSNVYFAKSLDERFIIKQVKKTELDAFEKFASKYFKHLTDSLSSGSPTCLAKVLGIYQVSVKHLKGGKEMKMDLMVMENLFFNRSIARVYDLKGSVRSRHNPDATGTNKVLLDMNLMETLRTEPIFLGSKAKRNLERAMWNDTSFLASVDVMDYSLLVGVDEERKELVLGIIDFMRQYTWDKVLETWVKASGILGGPRNASPTIISPQQYKKRFRKAMTSYFRRVPDRWSS